MHFFVHSCTHHAFIHAFISSFFHSLIDFIHALIHSFIDSALQPAIHPSTHLFLYTCTCVRRACNSCMHSFFHSSVSFHFNHSFMCSFVLGFLFGLVLFFLCLASHFSFMFHSSAAPSPTTPKRLLWLVWHQIALRRLFPWISPLCQKMVPSPWCANWTLGWHPSVFADAGIHVFSLLPSLCNLSLHSQLLSFLRWSKHERQFELQSLQVLLRKSGFQLSRSFSCIVTISLKSMRVLKYLRAWWACRCRAPARLFSRATVPSSRRSLPPAKRWSSTKSRCVPFL